MPRKLLPQYIDPIALYAPLIREYIEAGEADLGIHSKPKISGFRAKLTHLKSYAYTRMNDGDTTAGRVHVVIRWSELDWEPVNNNADPTLVHVYWRPDRIMAARAAAGLPVTRMSQMDQEVLDEARTWLLDNL